MLPISLSKLAINFNIENKGFFPYYFVNDSNISLVYRGTVPAYNYFYNNNISYDD